MEVSKFISAQFQPLIIEMDSYEPDVYLVAYSLPHLVECGRWELDYETGNCVIRGLVKIIFTFDGDITSPDFDSSKSTVYTIIATKPTFIDNVDEIDDGMSRSIWQQIINIFDSGDFTLPEEMKIGHLFEDNEASFVIVENVFLFPSVHEGNLTFEVDRL